MIGMGCLDVTPYDRSTLDRVLDSGLITAGPILSKFERDFAARHNCAYGLMVNSGTDALRIALAALIEAEEWQPGDEVIVPALTFIATANIVIQNGLVPIFVDVEPETFNIAPASIRAAITPRTRAIIPVHLFGLPCDMDPIVAIARAHGLKIIEDSCETMGIRYKGWPVGSFGDIACFSTYAAHIITTGVGGLAITSNGRYAEMMRSLANHGRDPEFLGFQDSRLLRPERHRSPEQKADLIARRFKFDRIGYSCRITQMEAALGLGQLQRIDDILRKRAACYTALRSLLGDIESLRFQRIPADHEHSAMMFPVVLTTPEIDRHRIMLHLEKQGIETRPFFDILGQSPYVARGKQAPVPNARFLSANGFYLPCHQQLTSNDLAHMASAVREFVDSSRKVAA